MIDPPVKSARPPLRLVLSGALFCLFLGLLFATYGAGLQPLFERAATFYSFASNHAWLLLLLYVVRLPLLLPASLVLFLTGMLCGPAFGECIAVAGLTLGGSIEFLVARGFAAPAAARLGGNWWRKWREQIHRAPYHAILMLRICFVPFDGVNVAAAAARAPLRAFVFGTALGVAPTSLPFVMAGASVDFDSWIAGRHLWPGEGVIHWQYMAVSLALAALIGVHARGRRAAADA